MKSMVETQKQEQIEDGDADANTLAQNVPASEKFKHGLGNAAHYFFAQTQNESLWQNEGGNKFCRMMA